MGVVANLVVRLRADITDFEKHVNSLEKSFGRVGGKLQTIGSSLTRSVTLPLAAIGAGAVKAAMDFESSFAGVRKTVNATEPEFAKLAQGFRDMAKTIPVSVNELNKIGESAGQLGIRKENILGFTRVIADLGVTTNLSTEQAASSLAKFANITQMPQDQFDQLGATIVALGNNFATTETDIVEFGLRIAGAGELAGLTEAQILSIGTALSSVGVEAEAGGTAVQKVLLGMTEAVATGNKDLAVFAETAGMTGAAFAQLFRSNAAEAFTQFVEGLGRQGQSAFITLENLGMADQRLMRSFLSLAGAGDLLRRSVDLGTQAWQQNAALTTEAEQRYKTFASQVQVLWNWIYDLAITIGADLIDALLKMRPAIENVLTLVAGLVDAFANMPTWLQTSVIGVLAFTAALGPLLWTVGEVLISMKSLIGLMKLIGGMKLGGILGTGLLGGAGTVGVAAAGGAAGFGLGRLIDEKLKIGGLRPSDFVELMSIVGSGKAGIGDALTAIRSRNAASSTAGLGLTGTRKADIELVRETTKATVAVAGLGSAAALSAKKIAVSARLKATSLGGLAIAENAGPSPGLLGTGEIPSWLLGELPSRAINPGLLTSPNVAPAGTFAPQPGFFSSAFGGTKGFGSGLASTVMSALTGGGNLAGSIAGFLGGGLGNKLGEMAGKMGGMLGGALSAVLPGIGSLLGPLVGWISNLFGQAGKTRKMRDAWIAQAGGLEKVKEMAAYAGVSIDKLLSTKKTKTFEAEVKKLEAAFAAVQERVKGLLTDLDKTLSQGGLISGDLWKRLIADADKAEVKDALVETFKKSVAQAGSGWSAIAGSLTRIDAGGLGNLGVLAQAAFSGMATSGMTVVEILKVLGPGLDNLSKLLAESGLQATGFLGELMGWQGIVAANQPLFDQLAGLNDMMVGLANAGLMTQETFSALGSMITGAFGQLTAQGVAGATALQMMQPQLQNLWMLMQQFGFAVDESTQALIDQGLEAGIIGPQFKDINQQILDVLKAIATVLGADIPAGFAAASQAAAGFGEAVGGIPGDLVPSAGPELPSYATGSGGLRNFGSGTLAMLHGNEAVLTDEQLGAMSRPSLTFNISSLDPRGVREVVEQEIAPYLADVYSGNMGGLRSRTRVALGVTG